MRRGAGGWIVLLALVLVTAACSDTNGFLDAAASESPSPEDSELPSCPPPSPPYTSEDYGGDEEPPDDAPEETSCQARGETDPGNQRTCFIPFERAPSEIVAGEPFRVEIPGYLECWGFGRLRFKLRQQRREWNLGSVLVEREGLIEVELVTPADAGPGRAL